MSPPVYIRPAARAELSDAVEWLECQRAGSGTALADAVQDVLREITDNPPRYPKVYNDAREAPVAGFRYCVYYRVRPNRLEVLSIFHTSRDPSVWQSRA